MGTLDEGDDLASGKAVSGEVAEGVHSLPRRPRQVSSVTA